MPMGTMVLASKRQPTRTTQRKNYVTKKQLYKAIHSQIENKVNSERMNVSFSSVGNTWNERIVSNISQGTQGYERVGNVITIRSLEINGVIAEGSSEVLSDDPYNVMRIVIARWAGGTVTTPLATASFNMNDVLRKTNAPQGLLKKYYDKYVPLQVTSTEKGAGDGYTPQLRKFKYFKIFKKGLKIDFGGNNTTTPNQRLIVSMISDSTLVSHPGFVAGYWAISYEDA